MSQISGPHSKSKPTPLSQSGLQDPIGIGGGQQLIWLRIEVLDYFFLYLIFLQNQMYFLKLFSKDMLSQT